MVYPPRPVQASSLVDIGRCVRYLLVPGGSPGVFKKDGLLDNAIHIRDWAVDYGLDDVAASANNLVDFLERVPRRRPDRLTVAETRRLRRGVLDLHQCLDEETSRALLQPYGSSRFRQESLTDGFYDLIGREAWSRIPEVARLDLLDAGRAMVLGIPTGSAFFLMRATEGTLRAYATRLSLSDQVSMGNWGPVVEALRRTPTPDRDLLALLDELRRTFRNPTQHPDRRYTLVEAEDLAGLAIPAIRRMGDAR